MDMTRVTGSGWVRGIVVSLLLVPASAAAAPRPVDDPAPRSPRAAQNEDDSAREELAETIEIYMLARMKRTLRLTDAQERTVIPLVEELNAARREANKRRRLTMMKLQPLIEDESSKDTEFLAVLDDFEQIDTQLRQQELKTRSELRATLTPRQQALFIGFQDRFRREMEERLRRIQHGENGPGPGGGPMRNPPPPGRPRPRR